jgi:alpha-ribazole phosphatase/probable phosphoglycerate mutase
MLTKLYLIRHGETEDRELNRYKGHIDVPLSENGIRQMEQLSKYIVQNCSNSLNAIYTSDLSRALKSAEIIAKPHSIKPVVVKDLRERNFGLWEGMSFDEIRQRYPDEFKAWRENPLKFAPMQGESTIEVKERALKAFYEIIERHKGENLAIVAHGGINRIILCHLLGIPLENIFRIEQDFGALNIIEFHDEYPVIKLINYLVQTV